MSNLASNGAMTNAVSRNQPALNNWLTTLNNRRGQITNTVYDLPYPGFVGLGDPRKVITQRNLRNRVSYTTLTDTGLYNIYSQGTFYTYDILGNVDHLLQDYGSDSYTTSNVMNKNGNRWKKISYQYDLISGKVNMVMYQQGWRDGFFHRYSYDEENRLTLVETSSDSLVWEKDARYEYYRHGPLARVTLGDQEVQGLDYAYTLQGWLKGINSTGGSESFDMGEDGKAGSLNQFTARDALGLTLNYFGNDYSAINGQPFPGYSGNLPVNEYRPLYNGNISSSSVYQKKFDYYNSPGGPLIFYNYQYDQLNRLTGQDAYKGFNSSNNSWNSPMPSMGDRLKERIAYDANGNILKYLRNSINPAQVQMDSLNYSYYPNTNRLRRIRDAVSANGFNDPENRIVDIDSQPDTNYVYDAIGNLIEDKQENITGIKWNVYGKIEEINRTATATVPASNIRYTYDAMGNRISQVVSSGGTKTYTWYVRDAQGNIMTTYSAAGPYSALDSLKLKLADRFLYGSSRLGTITVVDDNIDDTGPASTQYYYENRKFAYDRGFKQYELTNHLGNVLATVSDRKFGVSSGGSSLIDHYDPHIVTAQDYYPFGMLSRVALPNNNKDYKFGFNGQEMSNEVKGGLGNSYTAMFWEYDSRIGRRWNLDPRPIGGISEYSAFNNNPILYNDPLGDTSSPSSRSAFGQKGFVNLAKYKAGALDYEGNIINKINAGVNNGLMAPAANLIIDAIDGVANPGWTLTNMKDGIVGGFQSLGKWFTNHPDPVVGVSEIFNGAISFGKKNWDNPDFHLKVATMGLGVFGGSVVGSRINFTLKSNPRIVYRFDTRSPAEIEAAGGFKSWGNNMFLEDHVFEVSLKNKTSGYISTTKVKAAALEFADGYDFGYIYKIKAPRSGLDVNAIFGSRSPFPWEQEIAIPKKISYKRIISATKTGN